ncbi:hypothetical protein [Salinispora arenicola]|uniref:hypothetical protein n=1 Tax=Salinispora arenicola TaxID=168697 RepID=UPI00169FCDA1|nr:hypothetical protein [Salinispora arenicola]NIL57105.1 hypothetical protein [Salinispora arenicola]NIL62673.1 hypothetical protein [Salinispora arenicola]
MSTNYYLRTADTPDGDEGIHLGKHTAGGFTFRAHPDQGVTDYPAWLAQLDQGVIVSESGYTVTRDEMVAIAAKQSRTPSWVECGSTHTGGAGFYDLNGRRWLAAEFC